jgi:hypothetical protein
MEGGELDEARWYYDQSLAAFRETGDPRFEGRYSGYLGCLDWEAGRTEDARARLTEAIAVLERTRTLNYAPLFRAVLGGLLAQMGEIEPARAELDRAQTSLVHAGVPAYLAATQAHRGHVDLARARAALSESDGAAEAARMLEAARARLGEARSMTEARDPMAGAPARLLDCSDDVRFAVRMLERALDKMGAASAGSPLVVGPECRWFTAGNARVNLMRRGPMRLVLEALVRHRLDHPGEALRQDELLRAGWPGERVMAEAGSKRVRVAVAMLRRLGLEGVLVTRDDGYLIEAGVEVRRASA